MADYHWDGPLDAHPAGANQLDASLNVPTKHPESRELLAASIRTSPRRPQPNLGQQEITPDGTTQLNGQVEKKKDR